MGEDRTDRTRAAGRGGLGAAVLCGAAGGALAAGGGGAVAAVEWNWRAGVVALAVLIPLLPFLRGAVFRRLRRWQKCAVISLLCHGVLMLVLSFWEVSQVFIEYVARETGMTTSVNLDIAREVEVKLQIRHAITDLPVADRSLTDLARARPIVPPEVKPPQAHLAAPKTGLAPAPAVTRPQPPKVRVWEPVDRVALRPPQVLAPPPEVHRTRPRPIAEAERKPRPVVDDPKPAPRRATRSDSPRPAPAELAAAPTRPAAQSLVEPTPHRRVRRSVERFRPAEPAAPKMAVVPTIGSKVSLPPAPAPDRPADKPKPVRSVKAGTDRGRGRPGTVQLAAPTAKVTIESPRALRTVPRPRAFPVSAPPAAQLPPISAVAQVPRATPRPTVHDEARAPRPPPARPTPRRRPTAGATPPAAPLAGGSPPTAVSRPDASRVSPVRAELRPPRSAVDSRVAGDLPQVAMSGSLGPWRLTAPPSLLHRSFEQRQRLIKVMGGSRESESGVTRSLAYLAANQEPDGRWTVFMNQRRSAGRVQRYDMGITGLAALCFLASNHTPTRPGPHKDSVTRALQYLMRRQKRDGNLCGAGQMYCHAIATLALAEAAVMTGDARLARAAIKGAQFIVTAQDPKTGGWRYVPRQAGDTSVFGWQVLALHSVGRLGVRISEKTRNGARRWLGKVSRSKHRMLAGYRSTAASPAMTAEAVFSRVLLGEHLTEAQRKETGDYLLKHPPRPQRRDFYYWYYASLALMQMQNDAWRTWNPQMRQCLLDMQRRGGSLDGSWDAKGKWCDRGGRIYATAMATLTLQVYYRYLPMYHRVDAKRAGGTRK